MVLKVIVPALAGLFLAAPLSGQGTRFADTTQWRPLGGDDEIDQYVDVAPVRETGGGVVQISVGWRYKSVRSGGGRPYDSTVALWEVDCGQRRMRVLRYATHFREARLSTDTEPTDWRVPSPTAMTAPIMRVACHRAWAREDSLATPLSGQAAQFADTTKWRPLGANDKLDQYVDVASVRATGDRLMQISVGWLFKDEQWTSAGKPYDSTVALWEVDCGGRRISRTRVLTLTTYYRGATLSTDTEPTEWVVPSPTAATPPLMLVACHRAWAREDSLATPLSGQAAQFADTTKWRPLGGNDEVDQYVGVASARVTGDKLVQVSVGWLFKQAQSTPAGNPYDSNVARWEIDCGQRRMRMLTVATHFRENTLFTETEPSEWIMPSPTATAFSVMRVACHAVWASEGSR